MHKKANKNRHPEPPSLIIKVKTQDFRNIYLGDAITASSFSAPLVFVRSVLTFVDILLGALW